MLRIMFCGLKNLVGSHPLAGYDADGVDHEDGFGVSLVRSDGMLLRCSASALDDANREHGTDLEEPDLDAGRRPVHGVDAAAVLGKRRAERILARLLLDHTALVTRRLHGDVSERCGANEETRTANVKSQFVEICVPENGSDAFDTSVQPGFACRLY
jgi:hypothetical protein